MAFMAGSILYFGLRDGTQGKRVIQVLGMIEGQITGIIMMPISLIFFFVWVDFAFGIINDMSLGVWPFTLLSIAILLAGAKGLAAGFELIEQWTGVRSGHNPVATIMLANQASQMFKGAANTAKKAIGGGWHAISPNQRQKSRDKAQKIANSVSEMPLPEQERLIKPNQYRDDSPKTGEMIKAASALGRTVGAVKNPGMLVKNTSRAAGNAVMNKVADTFGNVKNYVGTVGDAYAGGKQAVDAFNKQHTPIIINTDNIKSATKQPQSAHEVLNDIHPGSSTTPITSDNSVKTSTPTTGGTQTAYNDGRLSSSQRATLLNNGESQKVKEVPLPTTPPSSSSEFGNATASTTPVKNTPTYTPKKQLSVEEQRSKDKQFAKDTIDRLIKEQTKKMTQRDTEKATKDDEIYLKL